jgi:EmrB/QacA subfamily drug resistance transporter
MLADSKLPCLDAMMTTSPDSKDCPRIVGVWVLTAAILGSSITFIDGTVVNVVLPILQSELGADVSEVQWIVEMYALMLSALILVGGSLGDRLGRRRIFMIGVLVFALSSAWCGLSPNIIQLIIARGVQGVGAALLVPGSLALISANFSKARRGAAIGTWSGFTSIAAGAGPILGGWLAETISWRWIFFINLPLAAAVLLISWLFVPESRDDESTGRIDWLGATLATLGLGGVVYGLIASNGRGFVSYEVLTSLGIGLALLIGFVALEWRQKHPMLPLGLFRSATFSGANLLTLFLYAALSGLLFFFPFMLIQVDGYSPTSAGAALVPFVVTMFVLSRWAGGLVNRYGSKLPLVAGPVIAGIGFGLFGVLASSSGGYWTKYFPAVMVMSLGMAVSVAPLTTTVMGAVEKRHAGIASGINNAVSRTAGLLAIAVFGVVLLFIFQTELRSWFRANHLPGIEQQVMPQTGSLMNMKLPDMDPILGSLVRSAIRDSFVRGFQVTAYLAALLGFLSAMSSWYLIGGKERRPS